MLALDGSDRGVAPTASGYIPDTTYNLPACRRPTGDRATQRLHSSRFSNETCGKITYGKAHYFFFVPVLNCLDALDFKVYVEY